MQDPIAEHQAPVMFIGGCNFHVDDVNNYQVKHFAHMLGAFDLKQHVNGITHNDGHTLDLVITRSEDSIMRKIWIRDPAIPDHRAIHCELNLRKNLYMPKNGSFSVITIY